MNTTFFRMLSKGLAVATGLAVVVACAPERPKPDAVVDGGFSGENGTPVGGVPVYKTIQAALDAAPAQATKPFVIFIKKGKYKEKITVQKPYIAFVGEDRRETVLTFDAAAGKPKPGGGNYGTAGSATLTVLAKRFRAENMTIENSFDYMGNMAKPDGDPTKIAGSQAVALYTGYGSDQAYFEKVDILGYQDTLFANSGTQYYRDCRIAGTVDFIFGAGQAVFDRCDIVSLDRGSPTNNGYITAASTSVAKPYGFVFFDCRLLKGSEKMADRSVALGRPWHPSADPKAVGHVAFIRCYMDAHISEKGWEPMSSTKASGERVWFYPEDARFYEYGSTGPGAVRSPTRRVLTDEQVKDYTIVRVLEGWDPMQE